jgi:hypothetical protein
MRICDFCKSESDKNGLKYQVWEKEFPIYHNFAISHHKLDICAKCYADIFNTKPLQDKLKELVRG